MIRKEERRSPYFRERLRQHRVVEIRRELRASFIAYALIRGKSVVGRGGQETSPRSAPDWDTVARLVSTYGPIITDEERMPDLKKRRQSIIDSLNESVEAYREISKPSGVAAA